MADKTRKLLEIGADDGKQSYTVDGKDFDITSEKKGDETLVALIKTYRPTKGSYFVNEDDHTLIPAGNRGGTGDLGMYPDNPSARRHSPSANSFDDIGRAAMEESEVEVNAPGTPKDEAKEHEERAAERGL